MKYLLDTNIIINHLRRKEPISREMIKSGSAISMISYGELMTGVEKSSNREKGIAAINQLFQDFPIAILEISQEIMQEYAKIKVYLEKKGEPLDDLDMIIAATVINKSLILITKNVKHFSRIKGLKLQ